MKWISIHQDEKPSLTEEVWVHDKEVGVTIGRYSVIRERGFWSDVYGDEDRLYEVTHWMPMNRPEPPEQLWII